MRTEVHAARGQGSESDGLPLPDSSITSSFVLGKLLTVSAPRFLMRLSVMK